MAIAEYSIKAQPGYNGPPPSANGGKTLKPGELKEPKAPSLPKASSVLPPRPKGQDAIKNTGNADIEHPDALSKLIADHEAKEEGLDVLSKLVADYNKGKNKPSALKGPGNKKNPGTGVTLDTHADVKNIKDGKNIKDSTTEAQQEPIVDNQGKTAEVEAAGKEAARLEEEAAAARRDAEDSDDEDFDDAISKAIKEAEAMNTTGQID